MDQNFVMFAIGVLFQFVTMLLIIYQFYGLEKPDPISWLENILNGTRVKLPFK